MQPTSTSDSARVYNAIPQLGRLREEVLLGDVWKQPELAYRDRILVTCAVLAAGGKLDELKVWMQRGVENGITLDEPVGRRASAPARQRSNCSRRRQKRDVGQLRVRRDPCP
jgi:hypothetical protein